MRRPPSPDVHAPNAATPPARKRNKAQGTEKLEVRFADAMTALGAGIGPQIVLALSGGGDSMALMSLLGNWSKSGPRSRIGFSLHALIVDHGLRTGSASEAKSVAHWARAAGWNAHILKWSDTKPNANIEDAARRARYALMEKWCRAQEAVNLFVGHTRDDVAETFLLRLGRGSGVDGLSAMRTLAPFPLEGFAAPVIARPLLDFGRIELRQYLEKEGLDWREDPMNQDPRFSRSRVRALLPALEAAGVSQQRIVDAARHLARAREALEADTEKMLRAHSRTERSGNVLVDREVLCAAPDEIALRALSKLIVLVSGEGYRPRFERLLALYAAICASAKFRARTLHGCRIGLAPKRMQVFGTATIEIKRELARKRP